MAMKFVKFGQNWLELGLHSSSSIGSPKYPLPDIYIIMQDRFMVIIYHL